MILTSIYVCIILLVTHFAYVIALALDEKVTGNKALKKDITFLKD